LEESPVYIFVVFLHVISAVASIGPFFILFPLLAKMRSAGEDELRIYLPVFSSAVRLSKHAGHVLVTTGIFLMILGGWDWRTSWVVLTILVMVGSLYFIARAFSPTIKKLREPDSNRGPLLTKLYRSLILYIALMLVMLWFMIAKPLYW
jgi:uncharacterized membrane protein